MKLSQTMLNFLGYMASDSLGWCSYEMGVGLAYSLGIKAALKNKLIEESAYTIELPKDPSKFLPGCPYGRTTEGFMLTDLGRELAAIGVEMRNARRRWGECPDFVARAQALLDQRQAA